MTRPPSVPTSVSLLRVLVRTEQKLVHGGRADGKITSSTRAEWNIRREVG